MQKVAPTRDVDKSEAMPLSLLDFALSYAARSWRVLPLHTPTSNGCSCENDKCPSIGKHPRIVGGHRQASADEAMIRVWWAKWPDANVGIVTGSGSGIVVLDIDGADGQRSLAGLGTLPSTLRANTGRIGPNGEREGFHLYFNYPVAAALRGSVGKFGSGLDIRADGGYVVAPPSLHATRLKYEWAEPKEALADAPTWLLAGSSGQPAPISPTVEEGRPVPEGARNDTLFRLACGWRRKGASLQELKPRLLAYNRRHSKPPLCDPEVLAIAESAAKYPTGGPDPLELASQKALAEGHHQTYDIFLAIAKHLQASRPGLAVLLPNQRISALIGCDRALVGRHIERAIRAGLIRRVQRYVPHRTAGSYRVFIP